MTPALIGVVLLAGGGLSLLVHNGRKLISDWPRQKPVHNVDIAWIQIYLGLALLVGAWVIATDPARTLIEPTPQLVNPESAAAQEDAAATRSR